MAIFSSLDIRRKASHKAEVTQPFITFCLRDCWFAMPVASVQKVVFLEKVYGDPKRTGVSLTRYQNQEILVIDVGYKIFGEAPQSLEKLDNFNKNKQRYLAILSDVRVHLLGLPIDSPPTIQRVSESGFTAIPEAYLAIGNIQCISSRIIQIQDLSPMFLLDTELLLNNFIY